MDVSADDAVEAAPEGRALAAVLLANQREVQLALEPLEHAAHALAAAGVDPEAFRGKSSSYWTVKETT